MLLFINLLNWLHVFRRAKHKRWHLVFLVYRHLSDCLDTAGANRRCRNPVQISRWLWFYKGTSTNVSFESQHTKKQNDKLVRLLAD